MCADAYAMPYMEVRGQFVRVWSLLLPCGLPGIKLRLSDLVTNAFLYRMSHLSGPTLFQGQVFKISVLPESHYSQRVSNFLLGGQHGEL